MRGLTTWRLRIIFLGKESKWGWTKKKKKEKEKENKFLPKFSAKEKTPNQQWIFCRKGRREINSEKKKIQMTRNEKQKVMGLRNTL